MHDSFRKWRAVGASGMLAAAWVLPVRAAMAMCARGGRNRFAWRPGQRACAGLVVDTPITIDIVFWRENLCFFCDMTSTGGA